MGYLTDEDRTIIRSYLEEGVLLRFSEKQIKGIAENGGVYFACGDGDVDIRSFHERLTDRPHGLQIFGGPLYLARSFRDYESYFAEKIRQNLRDGMEAKKTDTLFSYFHYPCGMAAKFGHDIKEVIDMALEVIGNFHEDGYFDHKKLHFFFHTKRINKARKEEQNTYKFKRF